MSAIVARLNAVLIGCGNMGAGQAKLLAAHPDFELTAVADVNSAHAQAVADAVQAKAYTDVARMLAVEKPDTVSICTANDTHAALTIQAANAGVKGIYCEKPMATCMADATAMVNACTARGISLVINHQRRLGADLTAARELIDAGALGDIILARGHCAGDILSDGTHAIDSLQFLLGDQEIRWVFGQVHRDAAAQEREAKQRKRADAPGTRYGHVVESGGMAVYELASGVRVELFCGDMAMPRRHYQDYEIFGTKGRLWRMGDAGQPNVFVQDARGGPFRFGVDENGWYWEPRPCAPNEPGDWRPLPPPAQSVRAMQTAYRLFAQMVRIGAPHPMAGTIALRGFEVVMAIYESARLRRKITLPLQQERFPLELLVAAGEL